jgi:hypothetical protein
LFHCREVSPCKQFLFGVPLVFIHDLFSRE